MKPTSEMTMKEIAAELDKLRGQAAAHAVLDILRGQTATHAVYAGPESKRKHAKLTAQVVHALRKNPPSNFAAAARALGVSRATISDAIHGKKWTWV